jgi:hypothetical protein
MSIVIPSKLVTNNDSYKIINYYDIDWTNKINNNITDSQSILNFINDYTEKLKFYESEVNKFYNYFCLRDSNLMITGNKLNMNLDLTKYGDLNYKNDTLHILLNPALVKTEWKPIIEDIEDIKDIDVNNINYVGNNTLNMFTVNKKPGIIFTDINQDYRELLFANDECTQLLKNTDNEILYNKYTNIYNVTCEHLFTNPEIKFVTPDPNILNGEIHTVTNFNKNYKLLLVTAYRCQSVYEPSQVLINSIFCSGKPMYKNNKIERQDYYKIFKGYDNNSLETTFSLYTYSTGITESDYSSGVCNIKVKINKSDNVVSELYLTDENNNKCYDEKNNNITFKTKTENCFNEDVNIRLYKQNKIKFNKKYKININALFDENYDLTNDNKCNIHPYFCVFTKEIDQDIDGDINNMVKYINYDEYIQLHENLTNQNVIDKVYILFDSEKFGKITYERDVNNVWRYYYYTPTKENYNHDINEIEIACMLYYPVNNITIDRYINPLRVDITLSKPSE